MFIIFFGSKPINYTNYANVIGNEKVGKTCILAKFSSKRKT